MIVMQPSGGTGDSWITPVVALSGVILSVVVSLIISGRSTYINSVTAERTKWLQNVRSNISKLCSLLRSVSYQAKADCGYVSSAEAIIDRTEIDRMITLISLQLNPRADLDSKIIRIIEKMASLAETPNYTLFKAEGRLVKYTQWLLKVEWERIKNESGRFWQKKSRREREESEQLYREFCNYYPLTDDVALPIDPFFPAPK